MKKYRHLSLEERERMYYLRGQEISFRQIAKELGRSHTTLTREWKRGTKYGIEYIPCRAHKKAEKKGNKQRSQAPLKSPLIFLYVRKKLRSRWSPETIAGRLLLDHPDKSIHHETIYRYIYRKDNRRNRLWEYLTIGRKRRMKKGGRRKHKHSRIADAVSIDNRSKLVDRRNKAGHWETDNMESPKGIKTALSATVERVTRYTLLSKMVNQKARLKTDCVVDRLSNLPKWIKLSLTADNGKENSYHKEITARLGMPVYFCHPYHSWEKGSVENMIGRVRRFLPKGTDLSKISDEEIAAIESVLNNTPRKCLGYLTPNEKMKELRSSFSPN